jgi:hypothetical protein
MKITLELTEDELKVLRSIADREEWFEDAYLGQLEYHVVDPKMWRPVWSLRDSLSRQLGNPTDALPGPDR